MPRPIAAVACLIGLAACAPSVPPAPTPGPGGTSLTVVSYNIRHGRGADDRVDLPRTAAVLGALEPDIVGLQEVDDRVTRSGGVPQADSLGALLGMHAAFGGFMAYQGGTYGMAILSRHPFARVTPLRLPDGNEPRIALLAEVVLPGADTITVVNVHFDWVADDSFRVAQATALAAVLDTLGRPYLLLGDFNDTPYSRTLELFTARAVEAVKPARDRFTFSAAEPRKEIDFLFAAPARAWDVGPARVVDERVASDHRPVVARMVRKARGAGGDVKGER